MALRAKTWTSRVRWAYQRSSRSLTWATAAGIFCSTFARRKARSAWAEVQATASALSSVAAKTKKLMRAAKLRNRCRIGSRTDGCIEELPSRLQPSTRPALALTEFGAVA